MTQNSRRSGSLRTPAAISLFIRRILASTHDTDFLSVFVYILGIFYLIRTLAFYPAEAGYIDHIR